MAMILGVLFTTCLLLASVGPARGQLDDFHSSPDLAVTKAQLLEFTQTARRLMREIQALPVDDSISVNPVVHQHARQDYYLIRAALHGIELARQHQTYQDPILILAHKKVEEAWNLARFPVDNTGVPRAEYIAKSVQYLTRSIQLVNQALAIVP